MPYITQSDRMLIAARTANDHDSSAKTAGELNYVLSQFIDGYMLEKGKSYQTMNDIIGVLEALKMEFYRRIVADYEDIKLHENGDVFDPMNLTNLWSTSLITLTTEPRND